MSNQLREAKGKAKTHHHIAGYDEERERERILTEEKKIENKTLQINETGLCKTRSTCAAYGQEHENQCMNR